MLEIGARNVCCVHRTRRENSLTREIDAGEIRKRAAGADELRATPIANWNLRPHAFGDIAPQSSYRLWRDAVREVFLGQANRAEGQGPEPLDHSLRRHRQLERSTADVHDDRA